MSERKRLSNKRGLLFLPPLLTALILVMVLSFLFAFKPNQNAAAADASTVAQANAVVILESDFEDNTTQGWVGRGAAVAVTDTEAIDTYSLLTTNRTSGWNGPSRDVLSLLEAGATYEISASVRLVAGEPASTFKMSMQFTPAGGVQDWDTIATSANVTDTAWVTLHGVYTFADAMTELTLYVESDNATLEFYIDDVVIVETAPAPGNVVDIALYDFEDNTTQGWVGRGSAVAVTDTEAIDTYSLLTTNRTSGWNGPSRDVLSLLEAGATYEISASVRLVAGEPASTFKMSMQFTPAGGVQDWYTIATSANVTDTAWVTLHGVYTFADAMTELTLYVESDNATLAFYIDDVIIVQTAPAPVEETPIQTGPDFPSIYETLSEYFIVGAAIEPEQLDSVRHTLLLTYHFNSITPENVMKPGEIHPSEGVYDWAGADTLVDFAEAQNMYFHGHTLVWHSQNAMWMFQNSEGVYFTATAENKATVLARLEDHIETVVTHYPEVDVWDVVNEVIDPNEEDCLRHSIWYTMTGTDFISVAFQTAAEFAPNASLIINDYSTTDAPKRACLYQVVEDLLAAGVPVEGIGHQMHINIEAPSANVIEQTLIYFSDLELEQHITELDMSVYTNASQDYGANAPEEVLVRQGYRYKDIFNVLRRQAAPANIKSVTFWGMGDDHTWLTGWPVEGRTDFPLLFDADLQVKPAYWGIVDPTQLAPLAQEEISFAATPVVDGEAELEWQLVPMIAMPENDTLAANFQTRWDENNLYVLVDVQDATQGVTDTVDMVEIFVDENNSKATPYDADDAHYTITGGVSEEISVAVTTQDGGYLVEAVIPLSNTAVVGQALGFDLRITDGSSLATPLSWNDQTHNQDEDTTNFGTLTLLDGIQVTEAIEGAPVIDGVEDEAWADANEISTDVAVQGTSGSTAKVKTLWDGNRLYVYAVVSDTLLSKASANVWEQDSIEVFVDQNNAKTEEYEAEGDAQYRINFDNEYSFRGDASADTITSTTRIITNISGTEVITVGYAVELMITLDITPSIGTLIGFDFQVNNDEDGNGTRDSVFIWNDPTGQSYQNTSRLGVLRFTGDYVLCLPMLYKNYVVPAP